MFVFITLIIQWWFAYVHLRRVIAFDCQRWLMMCFLFVGFIYMNFLGSRDGYWYYLWKIFYVLLLPIQDIWKILMVFRLEIVRYLGDLPWRRWGFLRQSSECLIHQGFNSVCWFSRIVPPTRLHQKFDIQESDDQTIGLDFFSVQLFSRKYYSNWIDTKHDNL